MESNSLTSIPANVAINGKLYFQSIVEQPSDPTLLFQLSSFFSSTASQPMIKLRVSVLRQLKSNPLNENSEYEAQLLFPINAVINYKNTTPAQLTDIDQALGITSDQKFETLRCISFGAREAHVEICRTARLQTEQVESDLARLISTSRTVNETHDAVLEISCIFRGTDDAAISSIEEKIIPTSTGPMLATPSVSKPFFLEEDENFQSSRTLSGKNLTLDNLRKRSKENEERRSEGTGTSTMPLNNFPAKVTQPTSKQRKPLVITIPPINNRPKLAMPTQSSMFQNNVPPTQLAGNKDSSSWVCFNCYNLGHRAAECPVPNGPKAAEIRESKQLSKVIEAEQPSIIMFCENCQKKGHMSWQCAEEKVGAGKWSENWW